MPRIQKSDAARADLTHIWFYIAEHSTDNADLFIDKLASTFALLAGQPLMGRLREELDEEIRSFSVGNYVIFYYPREYGVEIARVLHGALKLDDFFNN